MRVLSSLAFFVAASVWASDAFWREGELVSLSASLTRQERRHVSGPSYPFPGDLTLALAVPPGFSPQRVYPMLFVSVTGDRYRSNIEEMEAYWRTAVEKGWVVVTAQGERWPKRRHDTILFRQTYFSAAMRVLNDRIPKSREWPIVFAGFSGGSKMSQFLAVYSIDRGQPACGVFAAGCNENLIPKAARRYEVADSQLEGLAVFLSTGTLDTVSTVEQTRKVAESLRGSGIERIETFWHEGGHRHDADSLDQALDWFVSLWAERFDG